MQIDMGCGGGRGVGGGTFAISPLACLYGLSGSIAANVYVELKRLQRLLCDSSIYEAIMVLTDPELVFTQR